MELANIEKLIIKYENAETTLQEETLLREYFASENVAPHLEQYQMMFTYFQNSQDITYNKTIQLTPKKSKKLNLKWLSIAASIALIFSVYMGNSYLQQRKAEKQFAQVQESLLLLSSNLNKGNEAFKNLYAYEDTVNKIFKKVK